ncbi:MAG: ADP-ribosylglycohydrolase family protein [Akkermansiaceae bacterium]|nr:ADP-ribosylglycohydrolase family protein [Armatimonadota bacterium]
MIDYASVRRRLHALAAHRRDNGFDTSAIAAEVDTLPDSLDAAIGFVARLNALTYRDAILTHRGTGVYATMWTAAAIAHALTAPEDPLDILRVANRYIPQRSRFHEAMETGLRLVEGAPDWRSAYDAIHSRLGDGVSGSHCCVYEESATLINTLKHARRVDEGICLQVMQGNDTDSYAATAGSLLGAYLGAGTLDEARWVAPFRDTLRTALAWFYEPSLSAIARRMGGLPRRLVSGETTGTTISEWK